MYLNQLYSIMPKTTISRESFVKVNDFYDVILNCVSLQCLPCILVPYHICEGKRYEIYWYELNIVEDNISFKTWIENIFRKEISEINLEMIEHHKKCFLPISGNLLKKSDILSYFDYLLNSIEIKNWAELRYGQYNKDNLYIQLYL